MFLPILQQAPETESGWVTKAQDYAFEYGPSILAGILVLIVGRWVAKLIVRIVGRVLAKRGVDDTLSRFLCSILSMVLIVMVVITAFQTMGIETTSFVAVLGAATLAIGFALQGSLSNFAAGVMLILFRPFKAGDFIEAGGASGVVEEIGVFATTIKTGDNKAVTVPNSGITGGNIVNYSTKPIRRIDMVFGIGYGDDIKAAKHVMKRVLAGNPAVLQDPAPTIGVLELADCSVNIACRPWVKSTDYWPTLFALTERMKLEFDAAEISIPFPQQEVHMHQVA